jgi:hypothetical protein
MLCNLLIGMSPLISQIISSSRKIAKGLNELPFKDIPKPNWSAPKTNPYNKERR